MVATSVQKSLYNFVELDVTELGQYREGIREICDRKIDGLIVHNFFSQEEISKVVSQLTRRGPFPGSPFGDVLIYGPALYVSNMDIRQYCDEAVEFRQFCCKLFSGGRDFESRMTEVLGAMSGGRPVEIPTAPDGSPYTPTTIRVLEVGQWMGWHFGNQFVHRTDGYRHLSTLMDLETHLGYFAVLSAAESGGELILYDLPWSDTEWPDTDNSGRYHTGTVGGKPISEVMEDYDKMSFRPGPGDLVLFDDGRILHRVSTVEGSRRRITIGGFAALSKDRQKVYYWS